MMLQHFNSRHRFADAVFNDPFISLNLLVSASLLALAFRLPLLDTKVGIVNALNLTKADNGKEEPPMNVGFVLALAFGIGVVAGLPLPP
jgi:hypothetical protein